MGRASAHLQQLVADQGVTHDGNPLFTQALTVAVPRDIGDNLWTWSRRKSGDISPLVAVTGAAWLLEYNRDPSIEGVLIMTVLDEMTWQNGQPTEVLRPQPRRKVRGLRFPVLPSGSWLAQVGGGIAALAGVYLQFGLAIALIAGGLAAVTLGALREAGKV